MTNAAIRHTIRMMIINEISSARSVEDMMNRILNFLFGKGNISLRKYTKMIYNPNI